MAVPSITERPGVGRGEMDRERIGRDFRTVVNMSADEIEAWLLTSESRRVGMRKPGEKDSVGRLAGARTIAVLRADQLDDDDYRHMRRVVGFVRRHRAQEPANPYTSRWRYALMNWGHDPIGDRNGEPTGPFELSKEHME